MNDVTRFKSPLSDFMANIMHYFCGSECHFCARNDLFWFLEHQVGYLFPALWNPLFVARDADADGSSTKKYKKKSCLWDKQRERERERCVCEWVRERERERKMREWVRDREWLLYLFVFTGERYRVWCHWEQCFLAYECTYTNVGR